MPMNRKLYPPNWEAIALQIKEAANWTCQNCGRPCRKPKVAWFDFVQWLLDQGKTGWYDDTSDYISCDETGEWGYKKRPHRFTLTVAHLNHQPEDCRPENLKALCFPCHARYDTSQMKLKKRLKAERLGQMSLL
ncbi:hypothetical protein B9G53_00985 [Pseudanabaena sp. SR411]|uniref:hypothetical protein n=1 Tax=Pseudanabaena sp. SR411 TaxID=1980935 RepID=UPI000B97FB43|nr:hypothetical protein [Pseudanabaena sp. SR411]OYQ67557.1 hypothetical protein B9G53_00985 [Pseudanabaena sp. SR411]